MSFGEGVANIFTHDGIMSENQYKQMYVNSVLTREYKMEEVSRFKETLLTGNEEAKGIARENLRQYGLLKEDGTIDEEAYTRYEKLSELGKTYRSSLGLNYETAVTVGNMAIPMTAGVAANTITGGAATPILGLTGGELATLRTNGSIKHRK